MWSLIIYGVVAAAIAGFAYTAWHGFVEHISAPYVAAQIKSDQAHIDKAAKAEADAEAERDHAVADTVACVASSAKQSAEVDRWKANADRMAKAAVEARVQAQREAAVAAPRIADLQAKAAAQPKLMACEEELGKAKDVLRDALRARRGIAPGAK